MSFRDDLIKARSHIVFLIALVCGLALVLWLEGISDKTGDRMIDGAPSSTKEDVMAPFEALAPLPLTQPRASTPEEIEYAKIAWRYFTNNTSEETGLVYSADNYPSTTM